MSTRSGIRAALIRGLALLALAGLPQGALATGFQLDSALRSVFASVEATAPGQIGSETNGRSTEDFGLFDRFVDASNSIDGVPELFASANQDSLIAVDDLFGEGDAFAITEIDSMPDSVGAVGDSSFRLTFEVATELLVSVSLLATASSLDGGDAFAQARLLAGGADWLVTESDGTTMLSEVVTLLPGVSYELFANAFADVLDASGEASGSYGFQLTIIPEPGTLALVGPGLAVLGWRRRNARRG